MDLIVGLVLLAVLLWGLSRFDRIQAAVGKAGDAGLSKVEQQTGRGAPAPVVRRTTAPRTVSTPAR